MGLGIEIRDRNDKEEEKREMPTFLDVVEVLAFNKRKKIIRLRGIGKSKKYVRATLVSMPG